MKISLVEKDIAPYGVECAGGCRRIAKAGQFVLWQPIPHGHIVFHKDCLAATLDKIPEAVDGKLEVEYNRIRNEYINSNCEVFDE